MNYVTWHIRSAYLKMLWVNIILLKRIKQGHIQRSNISLLTNELCSTFVICIISSFLSGFSRNSPFKVIYTRQFILIILPFPSPLCERPQTRNTGGKAGAIDMLCIMHHILQWATQRLPSPSRTYTVPSIDFLLCERKYELNWFPRCNNHLKVY